MEFDKKIKAEIINNICLSISHGLFAGLFGGFIHNSKHYNDCSTNSSIYIWGYTTFLVHIVSIGVYLLLLPLISLIILKSKVMKFKVHGLALINVIKLLAYAGQIVCFSGLCYAFGEKENCEFSDLNKLTLAYIILVAIGLGMALLVFLCFLCCGMGIKFALTGLKIKAEAIKSEESGRINPENNQNP